MKIKDYLLEKFGGFQKFVSLFPSTLFSGGSVISKPQKYTEYASLYQEHPIVYASIFAISSIGAEFPIKLYKITKEKAGTGGDEKTVVSKEEIVEHKALEVLYNPNKLTTKYDLIEESFTYLELSGDSHWELSSGLDSIIERNLNKDNIDFVPQSIFTLRPDRIKTVVEKNKLLGYEYSLEYKFTGKEADVKFFPNQILHFKYFNPVDDWLGQSSIQAATNTALQEQAAVSYNKTFFENDATPTMIILLKGIARKLDKEDILEKFEHRHKGKGKNSRIGILSGQDAEVIKLETSRKDMDFSELKKMNREEFMACFGTNNAVLGLTENMTYDNYRSQMKVFANQTMRPKCRKIESTLNKMYLPRFLKDTEKNNYELRFDLSEYLTEDELRTIMILERLFKIAGITPNEVIKILGKGNTYTGGDAHYSPQGMVEVGATVTEEEKFKMSVGNMVLELQEKVLSVLETRDGNLPPGTFR